MKGPRTPYGTLVSDALPWIGTGVTSAPSSATTASMSLDLPIPLSPSTNTATWLPPWRASTADIRSSDLPVKARVAACRGLPPAP